MWRRLLPVIIIAVAVYAAFSIYAKVGALGDRLAHFAPGAIFLALGLAFGNYVIRFFRWQAYLRTVEVAVPTKTSALVFLGGFAMGITPGKLGELVKAVLLRDAAGADVHRVAPVVIAERLTDLVSVVVLALAGVAAYGVAIPMVVAGGAVTAVGLVILAWPLPSHAIIRFVGRLGKPGRRLAPRLLESYDHLGKLVRPGPLAWGTLLGVAAWLCECLGFAFIVRAFPGASVSFGLATLIYAATTLAGALSFLPGGLVVTEASMALLLVHSAHGLDKPAAIAATFLTRLCTLWFAVLLGLVALVWLRRGQGKMPA
jgi:uncharacterized membrane protein YbhN (UPF0104 family)